MTKKKFEGGVVKISLQFCVDANNQDMIEEAKMLLVEDLQTAIKYGEIPNWVVFEKDDTVKKSDVADVLNELCGIDDEEDPLELENRQVDEDKAMKRSK